MRTKAKSLFINSIVAGVIACPLANAAVVIATDNQHAGANDVPLFTPTYTISPTNNVLAGLTPTESAGNFEIEFSGGLTVLTDGEFGAMNNDGGPTATHPSLATFGDGGGAGSTLTYTFAATPITSVIIYGGWNDAGRDQQSYTVQASSDNGATYFDIGTVDYNPADTVGQSANRVAFTDDEGLLAGGASLTNLRINANATENGYAGLAEITAYAVPEPTTVVLGLLGAIGLLRRRRA